MNMNPFEVLYNNYEEKWKTIDHRLDGWLFMSSIVPPTLIALVALALVVYGPIYMRTRPPLNIGPIIFFFNIFIVTFNLYIASQLLVGSYRKQYNWACHHNDSSVTDEEEMRIVKAMHLFFICKMMELFDTCFMIARKKTLGQNTVIFVHHAVMAGGAWVGVRWIPCAGFTVGTLNTVSHAVMYAYFGLVVLSPNTVKSSIVKTAFSVFLVVQQLLFLSYSVAIVLIQCQSTLTFAYVGIALMLGILIYHAILFVLDCRPKIKKEGFSGSGIIRRFRNVTIDQGGEVLKYD